MFRTKQDNNFAAGQLNDSFGIPFLVTLSLLYLLCKILNCVGRGTKPSQFTIFFTSNSYGLFAEGGKKIRRKYCDNLLSFYIYLFPIGIATEILFSKKEFSEKKMVWTGRMTVFISMVIAILFTWKDLLGIGGEGGFTFIQKYTGFISPGVFAMFILGFFWKRTTGNAALVGLILGFVLAIFFNNYAVGIFGKETLLYTAFEYQKMVGGKVETFVEIPFLINMGWSFFFTVGAMVLISFAGPKVNPKAFDIDSSMFKVKPATLALIVATLLILTLLYVRFW